MGSRQITFGLLASAIVLCLVSSTSGQNKQSETNDQATRILGTWEIFQIKEPGQTYRQGYKGRPFVPKGPNAFTLLMEYRTDGTYRRISRVGATEIVHEGKWSINGHELRHQRKGNLPDEVMYIRFDGSDKFTSIEVFEQTTDPGLFAQFRRPSSR